MATAMKTQVKVGKAQALVVESLMWVTKSATRAKMAIAKLKWGRPPWQTWIRVKRQGLPLLKRVLPPLARFIW